MEAKEGQLVGGIADSSMNGGSEFCCFRPLRLEGLYNVRVGPTCDIFVTGFDVIYGV